MLKKVKYGPMTEKWLAGSDGMRKVNRVFLEGDSTRRRSLRRDLTIISTYTWPLTASSDSPPGKHTENCLKFIFFRDGILERQF